MNSIQLPIQYDKTLAHMVDHDLKMAMRLLSIEKKSNGDIIEFAEIMTMQLLPPLYMYMWWFCYRRYISEAWFI